MELNINEALRYLGVREDPEGTLHRQMTALSQELQSIVTPRHTWVLSEASALALPGRMAEKMLAQCKQAAILVCTLGQDFDRRMRQLQSRDMARAVMLDALGSVYVEAACDEAEKTIVSRFPGMHLTDRFSPGYGDLPLDVQPRLMALAGASRIGVTLTESLLMVPQKSVTAIIGIADTPQPARVRGCAYCPLNKTCQYRKAGITCHV